jgi:ATP-binding cassette subfamily B protein RaxB
MRMPMGYLTPVGDMGSTLSGGQRQRICLARALYAEPRILFLDEATSHLDAFTEHRIHEGLRELDVTCIIVAHRRETLSIADRVIRLESQAAGAPGPARPARS